MIYAVPPSLFDSLKADGTLANVQDEIRSDNSTALANRVANGQLVEAKSAEKHAAGERDRCYLCGDEVTPFYWAEKNVVWFKHLTNRNCVGHPANPRGVYQHA